MSSLKKYFQDNPIEFFRSGPEQGLKFFKPQEPTSTHDSSFKSKKVVYASADRTYAAGFCFPWSEKEGFEFGRVNNDPYELIVPIRFIDRLKAKCSLYILEGNFQRIETTTNEYVSYNEAKVIKEIKYNNCLKCLSDNGVKLTVI